MVFVNLEIWMIVILEVSSLPSQPPLWVNLFVNYVGLFDLHDLPVLFLVPSSRDMTLPNLQEVMESDSSASASLHPTPTFPSPQSYTQPQLLYANHGLLSPTSSRPYPPKDSIPLVPFLYPAGGAIQNNGLELNSCPTSRMMSTSSSSNTSTVTTTVLDKYLGKEKVHYSEQIYSKR